MAREIAGRKEIVKTTSIHKEKSLLLPAFRLQGSLGDGVRPYVFAYTCSALTNSFFPLYQEYDIHFIWAYMC